MVVNDDIIGLFHYSSTLVRGDNMILFSRKSTFIQVIRLQGFEMNYRNAQFCGHIYRTSEGKWLWDSCLEGSYYGTIEIKPLSQCEKEEIMGLLCDLNGKDYRNRSRAASVAGALSEGQ